MVITFAFSYSLLDPDGIVGDSVFYLILKVIAYSPPPWGRKEEYASH